MKLTEFLFETQPDDPFAPEEEVSPFDATSEDDQEEPNPSIEQQLEYYNAKASRLRAVRRNIGWYLLTPKFQPVVDSNFQRRPNPPPQGRWNEYNSRSGTEGYYIEQSAPKHLHRLAKQYADLCNQLERLNSDIDRLERKQNEEDHQEPDDDFDPDDYDERGRRLR